MARVGGWVHHEGRVRTDGPWSSDTLWVATLESSRRFGDHLESDGGAVGGPKRQLRTSNNYTALLKGIASPTWSWPCSILQTEGTAAVDSWAARQITGLGGQCHVVVHHYARKVILVTVRFSPVPSVLRLEDRCAPLVGETKTVLVPGQLGPRVVMPEPPRREFYQDGITSGITVPL